MNIYKVLNDITKYIDDNLDNQINYDVFSKMMGVNIYTLQRIFSLLSNVSLTEYIRKRRLSRAGYDLYNSKVKVMDIAIKYGYNNATSFSRAFENFHGIKPSKVNKLSTLREFPRIIFNENIKITNTIEYEIVELKEINLWGIGVNTNNDSISDDAPSFFEIFINKYKGIYGYPSYGLISYTLTEHDFCDKYFVMYDKKIPNFEMIKIPAGKWLKFRINSRDAKDIQSMSHKFYFEFLPSCKYSLREAYELEYYHDDACDFLVPIC